MGMVVYINTTMGKEFGTYKNISRCYLETPLSRPPFLVVPEVASYKVANVE